MLNKSILLPNCWVCPSKDGLNDHHVIPQAYGGVNGPQVTLCATHHTFIHTLSLRPVVEWETILTSHTSCLKQRSKLRELAELIRKAKAATHNMQRPIVVHHKLDVARSKKLKDLKFLLGQSSITNTVDVCIDTMYAQLTQLKK